MGNTPARELRRVSWNDGHWTHDPVESRIVGDDLLVTAVEGSDAWRITSYGFTHASEHALVAPLATPGAVEVSFVADLPEQFDQAGIFIKASDTCWIKTGIEQSEGTLQLGAVVTNGRSDWSVAPVGEWAGRDVTIRASREGDAITVRARVDDEPFRLVRVIPLEPSFDVEAGPFLCAPSRAGLTVRFLSWEVGGQDASLH